MASYYQDENKKWYVRFRYINKEGLEKQTMLRGFLRKKDAETAYNVFVSKNKNDDIPKVKPLTFSEIYERYRIHYTSQNRSGSVVDMEHSFKAFILPYFANKIFANIKKIDLLNWQDELCRKEYSHNYNVKTRSYLSGLYTFANQNYDFPNLMRSIPTIKNKEQKKEMLIWSPSEFNTFIENLSGDTFYSTLFSFLYLTGVRQGELQALTWADFKKDKILINKSVTRKHTEEEKKKGIKGYTSGLTKKYSSNREIIIPNSLIKQLNELRRMSVYNANNDFIFTLTGKCLSEHAILNKLENIIEKYKLKRIRVHDFRHSHASLLLSSGVPILEVSRRLGHSKPTQTLNTYGHLMPKSNDKILSVLDTVI